jgi:NitT/TauT family transport system permease protein
MRATNATSEDIAPLGEQLAPPHEAPHQVSTVGAISYSRSRSYEAKQRYAKSSLRRQATQRALTIVLPVILGAIFLLAWYTSTAYGHISSFVLPAPTDVFVALVDGIRSGLYWNNMLVTIQESLLGFLLALAVALPIGYGIAKSRFLANLLQPYLAAGQAVPAIVISQFLFIWLGNGVLPVMVICMLVVIFPLIVNTVFGVQSIDDELLDAARLEGAAGLSLLFHIEFPLALPAILAAVRSGVTLSITGAIVGEFFCNPDEGLGALVQIASHQYNMPFLFATILILALLAAVYYSATRLLVKLAEAIY